MKRVFCALLLTLIVVCASAVPAKPGTKKVLTLTDGSSVTAFLVGDEFGHYWMGEDGKAYLDVPGTDLFEQVDAKNIKNNASKKRNAANNRRKARLKSQGINKVAPYTGNKKGLIILVNFSDVHFKNSNADSQVLFDRIANEENFQSGDFRGSMYDYFYAQSEGHFSLNFDVVGPYTLSKNRSYYGANKNNKQGEDTHPAEMVIEALQLADADVNYSDYVWNYDNTATTQEMEQVYVVYAGKGEADGGAANTIWPHEWNLSSANYYGDGAGRQTLDGVYIDTYACGSELNGSGNVAGIGTMCHEFSHCLGYPDLYDTTYSGGQGMDEWDLMSMGSYNGNGYLPAGYTSYERWVAGWKEPIELDRSQTVTGMKSLQDGGESYIIYNQGNSNEYYLLENRQKTGWDAALPGAGLLILHVDYDANVWSRNEVNDDPDHQRLTWVPADGEYQYSTYNGNQYLTSAGLATDPYPIANNNSWGRDTSPAASLYNANNDGSYKLNVAVEEITQNNDEYKTISFNFKKLKANSSTIYKRVTSTNEMVSGARYIIACGSKSKAAGALSNSVMASIGVKVDGDYITANDQVIVFTVEGSGNNYTFKDASGKYLYSTGSKKLGYSDNSKTWTLSNGTNGVIMKYSSNGTMLYNANSPRFTVYTSGTNASMIQANLYMEVQNIDLILDDDDNNDVKITDNSGKKCNVTLDGRTLWQDDSWNTLCLPFSVDIDEFSPLDGAEIYELTDASISDGTLYLQFEAQTVSMESGKPYLVKWSQGNNIPNPVFEDVTISSVEPTDVEIPEIISFKGIFSPFHISGADRSIFYLTASNKLHYPNGEMTINAFRAYFKLDDNVTFSGVNNILLDFGEGDVTGIDLPIVPQVTDSQLQWFTIDGRKLSSKPTRKGIYIYGTKKVVL